MIPPQKTASGFFGPLPSGRSSAQPPSDQDCIRVAELCSYKPASGRAEWLSRDPIEEKGGFNLYAYVSGSPINWTDPLGWVRCCQAELDAMKAAGKTEDDARNERKKQAGVVDKAGIASGKSLAAFSLGVLTATATCERAFSAPTPVSAGACALANIATGIAAAIAKSDANTLTNELNALTTDIDKEAAAKKATHEAVRVYRECVQATY